LPATADGLEAFTEAQWRVALAELETRADDAVDVEVSLPFCAVRCLYCGCDVGTAQDEGVLDRYLDALDRDMALTSLQFDQRREALRVHLGGGTPNYLDDRQLLRVVETVSRHFRVLPETELSIECDPRRCSATQLDLLAALGFRRISFGMADLQPEVQVAVGRLQSFELMQDVIATARDAGFECVELDLVCGLPLQTEARLARTLEQIVQLGPDRVACLSYRHEPERHWGQAALSEEDLPDAALLAALRQLVAQRLCEAGYSRIGPDLFVLDTDELALARATRRLGHNLLGFGAMPAEHVLAFGRGRLSDVAGTLMRSEPEMLNWQGALAKGCLPVARGHRRTSAERRRREVVTHLMCQLEVPAALAIDGLEPGYRRLAQFAELGLVDDLGACLRVTPQGEHQLERLCAELDRGGSFGTPPPQIDWPGHRRGVA
jgi:oxygen-independent coproporphyrinogen-3 oxidase